MKITKIISYKNASSVPKFFDTGFMYKNNFDEQILYGYDDLKLIARSKIEKDTHIERINSDWFYFSEEGIYSFNTDNLDKNKVWQRLNARPYFFGKEMIIEEKVSWKTGDVECWLYNSETKNLIWHKMFSDDRRIGAMCDYFFLCDSSMSYIERVNPLTLKSSWCFKFDKNEKSSGSIHRHNNILIVPSTTLDEYGFIEDYYLRAIDLETGKVLWKEATNNQFCHDKKTGLMYSFWGCFTIVDPNKGIVFNEKIIETSGANNVKPISRLCHLEYPYLYFCTDNHHEKPVHFGRIDIESKILDFMIPSNIGPEVKFSDFAYHNQRFYLLDMKNVLHIYEMNE